MKPPIAPHLNLMAYISKENHKLNPWKIVIKKL